MNPATEPLDALFRNSAGYADLDEAAARAIQARYAPRVRCTSDAGFRVTHIAGIDTAFRGGGGGVGEQLYAAIVVLDAATLEIVETVRAVSTVDFDYVPGLLSFREVPVLAELWEQVTTPVDLLMVDGNGLLHPRRFGLACHAGVLLDVPTMGIAKNPYIGEYPEPAAERGASAPILVDGETLGRSVRTRDAIKPVYVSVGHRIDLDTAVRWALRTTEVRIPEPTRQADIEVNAMLRES